MTDKTIAFGGQDFEIGLVTAVPKHLIPPGAASFLKNVDFSRARSRVPKRRGIQVEQAELAGGNQVSGLFQYVKSTGSTFTIASRNNDVYSVSGGTWTSRYTGTMAGAPTNFETFRDLLVFVSETEPTQKWDGIAASFSVLLGTPPANAKFMTVWQNRVWMANTSAGKSRLHWSASGQAEDWVTIGDAGFIDIDIDDGDSITGIISNGNVLFVFKNNTVHMVSGNSPSTYFSRPVILNRGCVAPRSIQSVGPFIVYLSQYGVHSISQTVDGFLSEKIQFDIENLPKTGAAAGKTKDLYILAYDSDADGKNDSAYVIFLRGGSWSFWSNIDASVFTSKSDGVLISGGSDKTIIRKHDSGEDDEGTAIEYIWRSGQLQTVDFTCLNTFLDTWINTKPITGKILTVRLRVDGVQVDETFNDLAAHRTATTEEDVKIIGLDGFGGNQGRFLEIELYNNETAAPIEVTEISVMADVQYRQHTAT